ncbi:UNVERIFIED_CONTAM: hypothetical protein GTU68_009143 [Idotea baltica]|nr:hypothetical protein [Idotea baltica]
MPFIVA